MPLDISEEALNLRIKIGQMPKKIFPIKNVFTLMGRWGYCAGSNNTLYGIIFTAKLLLLVGLHENQKRSEMKELKLSRFSGLPAAELSL